MKYQNELKNRRILIFEILNSFENSKGSIELFYKIKFLNHQIIKKIYFCKKSFEFNFIISF